MSTKFLFGALVCAGLVAPQLVRADEEANEADQAPTTIAAPVEKPAKIDDTNVKGRLPKYYSKVGVTTEQKLRIYTIQSTYASKIDTLKKQLSDIEGQRDAEVRGVLTADQLKKLDDYASDRKSKKSSDAKTVDAKPNSMIMKDSTKVTESTAK